MKTAYEILQEHHDFLVKDSKGIIDRPSEYIEQYILEAMEEYASQSKWVSVKEHKPDIDCVVLVSIATDDPEFRVRSLASIDADGRWWRNYTQIFGVTHWQNLPDNPPSLTD